MLCWVEVGDVIIQPHPLTQTSALGPAHALPGQVLGQGPFTQRRKAPSLCHHPSKTETPPLLVPPSTGSHSPSVSEDNAGGSADHPQLPQPPHPGQPWAGTWGEPSAAAKGTLVEAGNPGPDSSKIPPRDASLGCHPLNPLLRNLHPCREPQVPIPSPRTPPPPTGPPVTLLPSYPPPSGQPPASSSHFPSPTRGPACTLSLGLLKCTTLLQPLPDQGLTSSPLPAQEDAGF